MRFVWAGAILLTAGCWTALAEPVGIKPETCLSVKTAALRLGELAETIRSCTGVINDKSLTEAIRLEATAQRGILYARRWRLTDVLQDAREAIADFSEGLRSNAIAQEKKASTADMARRVVRGDGASSQGARRFHSRASDFSIRRNCAGRPEAA